MLQRTETIRRLAAAGLLLVLAACAAPDSAPEPRFVTLEPVLALLVGDYAGVSWSEGEVADAVRLSIALVSAAPGAAVLEMRQFDPGGSERRFRIMIEATRVATRLTGSFEPLADDGSTLGRCALEVTLRSQGLLARTDAESCRFGSADTAVGLVKEIAHDGDRLVIADRVLAAGTDRAMLPDRLLEAVRVRSFRAWVGVRENGGEPWRMARNLEIFSDRGAVRPADPGGMALGVELDLGLHRVSAQGPTVLRLRAFDAGSGELLGQAWADPAAVRLGLALEQLQVGLELPAAARGATGNSPDEP